MAVKIHLEGDGLLYDDETSVLNAAQIIGFLKNNETFAASPGAGSVSTAAPSLISVQKPRISPREALQNSNAKTYPHKITVLGNYVAEQNSAESFGLDEVKTAFRRAGEAMPKNFTRDVKEAVSSNLIYDIAEDVYTLTDTAKEYLLSGFPENTKVHKSGGKKTVSNSRVAVDEALLNKLKESGIGDSLKSFIEQRKTSYTSKASNQVAIIASWLSETLNYEGISPSDLQTVKKYLGEPTGNPKSQINNAMARDGYFSHVKDGRFMLNSKGEDFGVIASAKQ